jgi:hypothetical protein
MTRLLFVLLVASLILGQAPQQVVAQAGGSLADKAVTRAAPAKVTAVSGALLARAQRSQWRALKPSDEAGAGTMLVALPLANLLSSNGAVGLALLADVGQRGPFPVLEAGAVLNHDPGADLDLTLDRGIAVLVNMKPEGAATARVRFRDTTWTLTLKEPGTRVGFELYARNPPGIQQLAKGEAPEPATDVFLLVVTGQVSLDTGQRRYRLVAPPGPALAHWQSLTGQTDVRSLDKLPDGVVQLGDQKEKTFVAVSASARRLAGQPLAQGLDQLLGSEERVDRLVGVTLAGAVDDLPRVLRGLEDGRHADLRDHSILVLRHWLGRGPGQLAELLKLLKKQPGFTEARAKTAVQLLLGFDEDERRDPATYDLLIEYLRHSRLAARELARWHLVRLVPAGKDIPYDAAGSEAERQRGYEQWRALIPAGQLPRAAKSAPPRKNS